MTYLLSVTRQSSCLLAPPPSFDSKNSITATLGLLQSQAICQNRPIPSIPKRNHCFVNLLLRCAVDW